MQKKVLFLLLLLTAHSMMAQRAIRRSSTLYVEAQQLPDRVEPMLTDRWHQYAPYNSLCPLDENGERCAVGCVATAMAEVMYYWRWPEQGVGYYEYKDSLGCKQTLSARFSDHTYDWDNILDVYAAGAYQQNQVDAVSLLCSDCGIAVNMRYGKDSSGAKSVRQPIALADFFSYDRGVQMYYRDFYSLAEITLMLKQELAAGRPVLISGYNLNGGHAYVIDGYNEDEEFHIALGMGDGWGDGWTALPNMTPDQPEWYDRDSPENGYNLFQIFVMGIMPQTHPLATGIERHQFVFQYISAVLDARQPKPVYGRNRVEVSVGNLANIGWNLHTDSVALMLMRDGERVAPLHVYTHNFLLEEVEDTAYTDTIRVSIPNNIADGVYTIVPMYRDNGLDGMPEWREARTSTGTPNYLIANIKGRNVTLSSDTLSYAYLTLEDIDFPDVLMTESRPEYSFTFRGHNAEMAGRFYLLMEPLDPDKKSFFLHRQGITIDKDEVTTRRFHKSRVYPHHEGQYRLHVCYEADLFSDYLIELPLPEEKIVTILPVGGIQIADRQ
jgi:hypothetical protein